MGIKSKRKQENDLSPQGRHNKKKLVLVMTGLTVTIGIAITAFLFIRSVKQPEGYAFLQDAIKATNELQAFESTIRTATQMTIDAQNNTMEITGILAMKRDMSKVSLLLNSNGASEVDDTQNFDVTTHLFSDGVRVYEKTGGEITESTVSMSDLKKACDGYKTIPFNPERIQTQKITISEREKDFSYLEYYLNSLPESIMQSHKTQYETLLKKTISMDSISVKNAFFSYIIQDGFIVSQTIQVLTEYTEVGHKYSYKTISEVKLLEKGDTYDFVLPK